MIPNSKIMTLCKDQSKYSIFTEQNYEYWMVIVSLYGNMCYLLHVENTKYCQKEWLEESVKAVVLLWRSEKWCFWKWMEPFRDTTNLVALFVVVCWQTCRQLFYSLIAGCYQGERLEQRRSLSHSGWNRCILISSQNTTATKM